MRAGQLYCIVFQRVFTLLGRFFFNFIECWMKAERFFCCFLSAGLERISLRKIPRRARASWGRGINLRTVELGSDWLPCFAAILRRLISVRLAAIYWELSFVLSESIYLEAAFGASLRKASADLRLRMPVQPSRTGCGGAGVPCMFALRLLDLHAACRFIF